MKKNLSPGEMLNELRSGSQWVNYILGGVDSSAVQLAAYGPAEGYVFLVINPTEIPLGAFHFNLVPRPEQFRQFPSFEAMKAHIPGIELPTTARLVVITGVFNEPRERITGFWQKILGNEGGEEERRLADARRLLLDMEYAAGQLRDELVRQGHHAVVVQALYDGTQKETYWDLERIVRRDSPSHAG